MSNFMTNLTDDNMLNKMFGSDMLGGADGLGSSTDIIAQLEQIQRIMAQQNDPVSFELPHKENDGNEPNQASNLLSDLKTTNNASVSDLDYFSRDQLNGELIELNVQLITFFKIFYLPFFRPQAPLPVLLQDYPMPSSSTYSNRSS